MKLTDVKRAEMSGVVMRTQKTLEPVTMRRPSPGHLAVLSRVYGHKQCDQKPEDYTKLGLGKCFEGGDNDKHQYYYCPLSVIDCAS